MNKNKKQIILFLMAIMIFFIVIPGEKVFAERDGSISDNEYLDKSAEYIELKHGQKLYHSYTFVDKLHPTFQGIEEWWKDF